MYYYTTQPTDLENAFGAGVLAPERGGRRWPAHGGDFHFPLLYDYVIVL